MPTTSALLQTEQIEHLGDDTDAPCGEIFMNTFGIAPKV
jgi:hypothetical protein